MIVLAAIAMMAVQDAPTYAGALRCFALVTVEAEARRSDLDDPELAAAFDAGIEWSMAAHLIRSRQGISWETFEADEEAATRKARADRDAGGAAVRAEIAACVRTAPPMPG